MLVYDAYLIVITYLCRYRTKTYKAMARPIKETPVLYGDDAKRFDERMKYNETHKATEIEKERIRKAYEYMNSIMIK